MPGVASRQYGAVRTCSTSHLRPSAEMDGRYMDNDTAWMADALVIGMRYDWVSRNMRFHNPREKSHKGIAACLGPMEIVSFCTRRSHTWGEDENEVKRTMHVNNNEDFEGGNSFDDVSGAGLLPGGSGVSDNSGSRSSRAYQWTKSPISERYQIAGASSVLQTWL